MRLSPSGAIALLTSFRPCGLPLFALLSSTLRGLWRGPRVQTLGALARVVSPLQGAIAREVGSAEIWCLTDWTSLAKNGGASRALYTRSQSRRKPRMQGPLYWGLCISTPLVLELQAL